MARSLLMELSLLQYLSAYKGTFLLPFAGTSSTDAAPVPSAAGIPKANDSVLVELEVSNAATTVGYTFGRRLLAVAFTASKPYGPISPLGILKFKFI